MSNELIVGSKLLWKRGFGEFVVCAGSHTADCGGKSWDGRWFVIGCPWFQIRFERHRTLTPNNSQTVQVGNVYR